MGIAKKSRMQRLIHSVRPVNDQELERGTILADGARDDIRIQGLFRHFQNSFVDVKVTNVCATSILKDDPNKVIENADKEKERNYKGRIQKVENATFTPAIFSTIGARSKQAQKMIAPIVTKTAKKKKEPRHEIA